MTSTKEINFDLFSTYFYYDETSPSFLRWKISPCFSVQKDDIAGDINNTGYWRVKLKYKKYLVARVIYVLHHLNLDKNIKIDHKDGNRLNNNINNLVAKTQKQNTRNAKKRKNNKSGVTGVCFIPNNWVAFWREDDKYKSKYFSIKKYGEDAFKLACLHRDYKIQSMKLNGYDYTERHGL